MTKNINIKNKLFPFLFLICAFTLSCDSGKTWSYIINNNSGTNVKVIYKALASHGLDTLYFNNNESKTIWVYESSNGGKGVYDREKNETLIELSSLNIFKNDTISINRNLLLKNEWTYKKNSRHLASYTLIINSTDF